MIKTLLPLIFALCVFADVAAQVVQTANSDSYPNELPSLKMYENAKWKTLRPYVSTIGDVEHILGKPVAVYDELSRTYVAGFQDDPEWTIVINVVAEGGELPNLLVGRVLSIELYPKKRISVVGADVSAFRSATYASQDKEFTSFRDHFGLRYVVYGKDTGDGRFRAGDLKLIEYGPSDELTEKYKAAKNRGPKI